MSKDEKKPEEQPKEGPKPIAIPESTQIRGIREVVIQTNGHDITLARCEASPLELKEICREILASLA